MSDFGPFGDQDFPDLPPDVPVTLEEDTPPSSGGGTLYNLIAIVFLLLTIATVVLMVGIYLNPRAAYNPFPPQLPTATATQLVIPTATATLEITELPPSWTPSATPGEAAEVPAKDTPPAVEVTPLGDGDGTPTPISTPQPGESSPIAPFPFSLQEGSPSYTQNLEENGGCAYLGIVGQVFDLDGEPLDGIAVVVEGENFETLFLTQFTTEFGAGSYEVELNTTPIEAEFEVQLWTVSAQTLSDKQVIRTRTTCEENLIFVNFVQNHEF